MPFRVTVAFRPSSTATEKFPVISLGLVSAASGEVEIVIAKGWITAVLSAAVRAGLSASD